MELNQKVAIIDTWLDKHRLLYIGATRHPFILEIRDGSVDLNHFKRWLGQDYIFIRAFVAFAASVLVKAWKQSSDESDIDIILGGLASINEEIGWFKKTASRWSVALNDIVPQQANNIQYCRFLESLMSPDVDYTGAITAIWVIEAVYQESFGYCLEEGSKTPEELKETCQRWGNDGFGQYCQALKRIAHRQLEKESSEVVAKAEAIFMRVLENEIQFWNMSRGVV